MAASRSISRVFSPAILHQTRNFATKIPDHKIWEEESASLRLRGPSPIGKPWPEYGLDYQHWLVQVKLPNREMSREEIIEFYVDLLAAAVGGKEAAKMKIYSVSTKHYYAFGALMDEKLASKLRGSHKVLAVDADIYLDPENKDYGGEPFVDGKPVPYEQKYHASYWKMQEALYRPPPGGQIDAEIPDGGQIYAEIPHGDQIDAAEILRVDQIDAEIQGTDFKTWLSRAHKWWNGPSQ